MHYTTRIRNTREDKDITQREIATILKMKQEQYHRYESGKRPLPIEHLITLCKYYNLSADYLLGLIDDPRPLR